MGSVDPHAWTKSRWPAWNAGSSGSKPGGIPNPTDPLGPAPEGADVAELAAWTVVSNVLLNLDETLMKP